MTQRTFAALFAAVLLVLVVPASPAAATSHGAGYGENGGDVTTTETNPEPGEVFGVTVEADACPRVRLEVGAPASAVTIDGDRTNTATKPAADGDATFQVAIYEEGEYRLTGYCDVTDEVLGVQMIVVGDGEAGPGPADEPRQAGPGLPNTGAEIGTVVAGGLGVLLLLAGGAVLLLRRRKASSA